MRSQEEANAAVEKYADTVWRICMVNLKSREDAEDIFQSVFLKYILSSKEFENEEHEKAWFIRVSINSCKDLFRSFYRNKTEPLDVIKDYVSPVTDEASEVISAVMNLPHKYRQVIYLYYYEGYKATEIAHIFKKNVNSIYTLLQRGKKLLHNELAGDEDEK